MKTLGFIGVGDLAEYSISGIRQGGYTGRILLSPRNRERSRSLAESYHCEVQDSNQAVVDSSDCIILSTRPAGSLEILAQLQFRPGQELISVIAGLSIETLRGVAPAELSITRAMPVSSARAGSSPTIIYPFNATAAELFNYCGQAITVDTESAFEQGSVLACVYTWYFELFQQLIESTSGDDLPTAISTELVLGMAKAAASLALQDKSLSPGEIANSIATEGTYSKLGLELLRDRQAFEPWRDACRLLLDQLQQPG
jgi:pyrroline-5-carboxylate reductase